MTTKADHRYVLRCLSAQGTAPELADKIQDLYTQNLAIAKQATIQQARLLVETELEKLPNYLEVRLDHNELTDLINCLF